MFPTNTRALIVDDMAPARELLTNTLKELGFSDFVEAANGVDAMFRLEDARKNGRPVGLVLCDIKMPEMDGLTFLRTIRSSAHYANLPLIMVTAVGESESVMESITLGASSYIIKPVTASSLSQKLDSVWSRTSKKK